MLCSGLLALVFKSLDSLLLSFWITLFIAFWPFLPFLNSPPRTRSVPNVVIVVIWPCFSLLPLLYCCILALLCVLHLSFWLIYVVFVFTVSDCCYWSADTVLVRWHSVILIFTLCCWCCSSLYSTYELFRSFCVLLFTNHVYKACLNLGTLPIE